VTFFFKLLSSICTGVFFNNKKHSAHLSRETVLFVTHWVWKPKQQETSTNEKTIDLIRLLLVGIAIFLPFWSYLFGHTYQMG